MISFLQCILLTLALLFSLAAALPLNLPSNILSLNITGLLAAHNNVRVAHGASPLAWSDSLAQLAAQWANRCIVEHTGGVLSPNSYGEIIAAGTGDFNTDAVVQLFTQDQSEYDPSNPTYNHFTQVVWKATTQFGCGIASCNTLFPPSIEEATLYVCLYDPPGNVIGHAPYV